MDKTKYIVELNWYGEVHTVYTSSTSEQGALSNSFTQLANRTGSNRGFIKLHFRGHKDNWKVTERTETK